MPLTVILTVILVAVCNGFAVQVQDPPILMPKFEPQLKQSNDRCGHRNVPGASPRIIGGERVYPSEIPWRVLTSIKVVEDGVQYIELCGATIIHPNWLMSAAHCIINKDNGAELRVYANNAYGMNPVYAPWMNFIVPTFFVDHPEFNKTGNFENDIRLIHVPDGVFPENAEPVCLPCGLEDMDFNEVSVLASGWGTTNRVEVDEPNTDASSPYLLKATLEVFSSEQCRRASPEVTDDMLCTYNPNQDTCQGDSGGSIDYELDNQYYAIGVVSHAIGCGLKTPGVNTKVTKYLRWMKEQIRPWNHQLCK